MPLCMLVGVCLMAGAYLAGLSLSQLPYRREIETKISSLQTFGMTLFYLMLGIYFR
jgi:Kef-type K+ transport system membrane component KefB